MNGPTLDASIFRSAGAGAKDLELDSAPHSSQCRQWPTSPFVVSDPSAQELTASAASLPPVVRRMLDPDFYPHPTVQPIRLIQTHISYVVLTGTYAYKVKKPVNLGFLDFSGLQQRKHFCHEELRLNRRGRPDCTLMFCPSPRRMATRASSALAAWGLQSSTQYECSSIQTMPSLIG